VLHLAAGFVLYVRAGPRRHFGGDGWRPESPKQRVLLGGYLALSFAWLQVTALMLAFVLLGNPLGAWLGVIGIVSFAGQSWCMRGNDPVAEKGLEVHLVVLLVWTAAVLVRGH
jgi:hypothetical protein